MRAVLGVVVLLAACGPSTRDGGAADAPSQGDAGPDTPVVDTSRVFAHSGGMLYRLNATTLSEVPIGPMTGLGTQSLTDLAIDINDKMVGITLDKLYDIDPTTGTVTLIKDLSQAANGFTSLSFVPDPADDTKDILVTANDQGAVFQIDPATGNATMIGDYGTAAAGKVRSSGDLFGVRGVGIFATVDVGSTPGEDFLAQIDPANGWKATLRPNGTGFDKIFGLGYWGGVIYGFVDLGTTMGGKMIQIDPGTGVGTLLNQSSVRWFGAGVATDAPIL
jgi:hypothetical protein